MSLKMLDMGVAADTNDGFSACCDKPEDEDASSLVVTDDVDSVPAPALPGEDASTLLFVGGATFGGLAELK